MGSALINKIQQRLLRNYSNQSGDEQDIRALELIMMMANSELNYEAVVKLIELTLHVAADRTWLSDEDKEEEMDEMIFTAAMKLAHSELKMSVRYNKENVFKGFITAVADVNSEMKKEQDLGDERGL